MLKSSERKMFVVVFGGEFRTTGRSAKEVAAPEERPSRRAAAEFGEDAEVAEAVADVGVIGGPARPEGEIRAVERARGRGRRHLGWRGRPRKSARPGRLRDAEQDFS